MKASRRTLLQLGGLALAGLPFGTSADEPLEILMRGSPDGADVWFDPIGLRVSPGSTVRWRNVDLGNSHTATAFHPKNSDHSLRIPAGATPWDSGYLLPEEIHVVTLVVPGVYDYFCIPHEMAGMVGRIVVSGPGVSHEAAAGMADMFPSVADILSRGRVGR